MKIEFVAGSLKNTLKDTASIASSNRTQLAWGFLLFNTTNQTVTATNEMLTLVSKAQFTKIDDKTTENEFLVEANKLATIVNTFSDSTVITLTANDKEVLFKTGKSRYKLGTLPVKDYARFNKPTEMKSFLMDSEKLRKAIDSTISFVGDSRESRPALKGLCLETDGIELSLTGTNGHQLSHAKFSGVESRTKSDDATARVVVPPEFFRFSSRLNSESEKIMLYVSDSKIGLATPQKIVWSSLIDAQYPPYAKLMEVSEGSTSFSPDLGLWKDSISRIKPLCDIKKGSYLHVSSENRQMKLSVDSDIGESEEIVEGISLEIPNGVGINVNYLDGVLKIHDSGLKVSIPEDKSGAIQFIKEQEGFYSHQMISQMLR